MKHKVQPEEAHYVIDAGRERILGVFYFLQDYDVVCLFTYLCTIFKAKLNYSINIEREIKSIYCSLQLLWTQTTLARCLFTVWCWLLLLLELLPTFFHSSSLYSHLQLLFSSIRNTLSFSLTHSQTSWRKGHETVRRIFGAGNISAGTLLACFVNLAAVPLLVLSFISFKEFLRYAVVMLVSCGVTFGVVVLGKVKVSSLCVLFVSCHLD